MKLEYLLVSNSRAQASPHLVSKLQLHVLSKARRVVIADGLRVSKRLKDGIGLQQVLLNAFHGNFLHFPQPPPAPDPRVQDQPEASGWQVCRNGCQMLDGLLLNDCLLNRYLSNGYVFLVDILRTVTFLMATC